MTSAQQEYYIGNQINDQLRGVLKLKYPFQKGTVNNWNEMEQLCKYTLNELKVNPKEVLILQIGSTTVIRALACQLCAENENGSALVRNDECACTLLRKFGSFEFIWYRKDDRSGA